MRIISRLWITNMPLESKLSARSQNQCELCSSKSPLVIVTVEPSSASQDHLIHLCETCNHQMSGDVEQDPKHWHCLNEKIWSPIPAVQVSAYRQLQKLSTEPWAQQILETAYLEPEIQAWADSLGDQIQDENPITKDSNGTQLNDGDTVTLIKDLDVKGAGFTAKRGTAVRGISLTGDPENIEGRVNGVRIVLKTCFLKKS